MISGSPSLRMTALTPGNSNSRGDADSLIAPVPEQLDVTFGAGRQFCHVPRHLPNSGICKPTLAAERHAAIGNACAKWQATSRPCVSSSIGTSRPAHRLRDRTARMEVAAGRHARRARHVAAQDDARARAAPGRAPARPTAAPACRDGAARRTARRGRATSTSAAEIHHGDPVRDVPHHRQIVRDEQVGDAETLLQVLQQVHHLRPDRHVERRHRFVGDDQPRLGRQRAGDARCAGAGRRRTRTGNGADAPHPARPGAAARITRSLRCSGWRAGDTRRAARRRCPRRLARAERRVRVLEHDLHFAPPAPQLRDGRGAADVLAVELDAARGRLGQTQQHAPGGGLAAARLADQRQRLAGGEIERHAVNRPDLARSCGCQRAAA